VFVEYDIATIVTSNSYCYKNIEQNEEIVKLILTIWGMKENTSREIL